VNLVTSNTVIDEPRYLIQNLESFSGSLFILCSQCFGSFTSTETTITNLKGSLGDYNKNILKINVAEADAIYMNRLYLFDTRSFYSDITIDKLSITDAYLRNNKIQCPGSSRCISSLIGDFLRTSGNVPSASTIKISKLTIKDVY